MDDTEPDREKPFSNKGYALMGAAFEVHRQVGSGLLEDIYQESLELELQRRGIPYKAMQELALFYKDRQLKKRYIPHLFVHEHIVVELRSVSPLGPEHEAQLIHYMRITRQPVGYLIHFAPIGKRECKRVVLSEFV